MSDVASIFSADWHFSSREEDVYRFDIFKTLVGLIQTHQVRYVFMLGDLTQEKDRHSAALVNRVVRSLRIIVRALREVHENGRVYMISGNHDFVNAENPFFKFLHRSLMGRINFYTRPMEIGLYNQHFLFLPFSKNWSAYAAKYDFRDYDRVLIHQPVIGAETETGQRLADGLRLSDLAGAKRVLGGDCHVPQTMGNLTYCGAPHPIRFGDVYEPRVLLETNGVFQSIAVPSIRKVVLNLKGFEEPASVLAGLREGDRIKVSVTAPRSLFGNWDEYARAVQTHATGLGVRLASIRLVAAERRPRVYLTGTEPKPGVSTVGIVRAPGVVLSAYAKARRVEAGLMPYAEELLNQ